MRGEAHGIYSTDVRIGERHCIGIEVTRSRNDVKAWTISCQDSKESRWRITTGLNGIKLCWCKTSANTKVHIHLTTRLRNWGKWGRKWGNGGNGGNGGRPELRDFSELKTARIGASPFPRSQFLLSLHDLSVDVHDSIAGQIEPQPPP